MNEKEFTKFKVYEEYTLKKNIAIYCVFNDLTKTQFAFYCGLEVSSLACITRKRPSDRTYKKISTFTGVPIRILKKLAITEDELATNVKENF